MIWDPRKYNTYADHAVNCALDQNRSWELGDDEQISWAMSNRLNLRLCVDGGLRGDGQAAAGMAIFAYSPQGGRSLLYRAGQTLGKLHSAFVSEVIALE